MTPDDTPSTPRLVLLVISGGADASGAPTPLHEAGTPALDRVARDGHLAQAVLGAASCWDGFTALLGLEPGAAPLACAEAVAAGRTQAGAVCRADFVTADDDHVLDPFGGGICDPEAAVLLEAVAARTGASLLRLSGHRNLWVGAGCTAPPPWHLGARAPRAVLSAHAPALALYDAARAALGGHDVNAVRVDLGENPANALWPHGGGTLPLTVRPPVWAAGRRVALVAEPGAPAGLAAALGWSAVAAADDDALCAAALDALATHDVVVVRSNSVLAAGVLAAEGDAPAARTEAFSALDARLASPLLGALEERGPFVFAVAADGVVDSNARAFTAEPVPCGLLRRGHGAHGGGGHGAGGHGAGAFHERACREAAHRLPDPSSFAGWLAHEFGPSGR